MASSSTPATGYPTAQYQNYPYPHQQNYQTTPRRRATLLRRVLAVVIAVAVVFGAATFIVWLVLRPKLPQFTISSFSLSNLTISNTTLLSFAARIQITARNPNAKISLSYDTIDAAVFYRSSSLSDTVVPPFELGSKSETNFTASFAAAGSFVDGYAADGISGERGRGDGNVRFNLRLLSRVRFKARAWRTRRRFLKVFCVDLPVGVPSSGRPGTLAGGPRQCRVWV